MVRQRARSIEQRSAAFEFERHASEPILHQGLIGDRLTKLDAVSRVLQSDAQGGLCDSDSLCRDAEAGVVHQREHGLEALAFHADEKAFGVVVVNRRGR